MRLLLLTLEFIEPIFSGVFALEGDIFLHGVVVVWFVFRVLDCQVTTLARIFLLYNC